MSDLQNDANYAKITNVDAAGHKLNVSMDTTDYVLTLKLLDKNENVIDIKSVDLPLEELVISGSYDATNKKIVLTLKSGQTIEIPVANLLAGLVNATRQVGSNDLSDDITPTQLFNDIKDLTGTMTNKSIDADDNDVSNLTVDNFKTGVIVGTLSATPSDKKIFVKLGGIDFTIKTEEADEETVVTVTAPTTDYPTAVETVTITKEETPVVEEVKEEKKPKEPKKTPKADTKKVEKAKPKKK